MSGVERLEDVVQDDRFIEVDLLLRRGHQLGRENHDLDTFVLDALEPLEGLYERYGARLIHRTDGCFPLVPSGDRLSRRQLTPGEMLVGQSLTLLYVDRATLESTGVVDRSAALERLIRGSEVVTEQDDEDPQLAEAVSQDSLLDDGADEAGEDLT